MAVAKKNAGTLSVYLTANSDGVKKGVSDAKKSVADFKSFCGSVGHVATGVTAGLMAMGTAIVTISNKLDKIGKSSRNLGISTSSFQKLSYAARRTNTDFGLVENGLMKIQKILGDALAGKSEAVNIFKRLGLDPEQLSKLNSEQIFETINSALERTGNAATRASLGAQLYGKSFAKLNNFLAEYRDLGKEAAEDGLIISDDEIQRAAALNDQLEKIKTKLFTILANTGSVSKAEGGLDYLVNEDKIKAQNAKNMEKNDIKVEVDKWRVAASMATFGYLKFNDKITSEAPKSPGKRAAYEEKDRSLIADNLFYRDMKNLSAKHDALSGMYSEMGGSAAAETMKKMYEEMEKASEKAETAAMQAEETRKAAFSARLDDLRQEQKYQDMINLGLGDKVALEKQLDSLRKSGANEEEIRQYQNEYEKLQFMKERAPGAAIAPDLSRSVMVSAMERGSVEAYRARFNNTGTAAAQQLAAARATATSSERTAAATEKLASSAAALGVANV